MNNEVLQMLNVKDEASESIGALVDTFGELTRAANTIKDNMDKVKAGIIQYLKENGLEETVLHGYKISYKEIESSRFDTTRFRHECPETYEQYVTAQYSMRFNFR